MQKIEWNYSSCVACGKCLKACYEANNKVLCYFDTILNNKKHLYERVCSISNITQVQCSYNCKDVCPNNAIT